MGITEGAVSFVRDNEYFIVSVAAESVVDTRELETTLIEFLDTFEFLDER